MAGPTVFQARAEQTITLFAGTLFNPTGDDMVDIVTGIGVAGINRDAQVGNAININSLFGWSFAGSIVPFGDYRFGIVGPFVGSQYSGSITDVVQNESDPGFSTGDPSSLMSGIMTVTGPAFGFEFLSGDLAGVILTTDPTQDFSFRTVLDGLPPSPGTVLINNGDDSLNILFNDAIIGTSTNRRIFAVPEPGSFVALSAVCGMLVLYRRRAKVKALTIKR